MLERILGYMLIGYFILMLWISYDKDKGEMNNKKYVIGCLGLGVLQLIVWLIARTFL